MGYYTHFEIGFIGDDTTHWDAIKKRIGEVSKYDNPFDGETYKWYDFEDDCRSVSAEFPDVLFYIDGEGEEAGDMWRCFFLRGVSELHSLPKWTLPERPEKLGLSK